MNREEQEQFSWVHMSHFNDPRDDASHIICNYDGIDLVRGAWRGSAKLDFENFLLSSRNCNPADTVKHCGTRNCILLLLRPPAASQNFYLCGCWPRLFCSAQTTGDAERWPSGLARLSQSILPCHALGSEYSLFTLGLGRTHCVGTWAETLGHIKKTGAVNIAALVKQQPWPALRADFCVKLPFNIHHTAEQQQTNMEERNHWL